MLINKGSMRFDSIIFKGNEDDLRSPGIVNMSCSDSMVRCIMTLGVNTLGYELINSLIIRPCYYQIIELIQWAKCGEYLISAVPTVLWAVGAAALAQRVIKSLFRRFLFRRVPLWELIFQHFLFIWMVIYSLHFWSVLVKVLRFAVQYCYQEDDHSLLINGRADNCKAMQQWMIWMFGVAPLAIYIQTRPRQETPPLMIWITASPWQRREMGPYGYYLSRPVSSHQTDTNSIFHQQTLTLRKAFSDSKLILKEPPKKKRYSKSV